MKMCLFLTDCNGFEASDPIAALVKIPNAISKEILSALEGTQPGARSIGGSWQRILRDGKINHELISRGKQSSYTDDDFDMKYKVISGNY